MFLGDGIEIEIYPASDMVRRLMELELELHLLASALFQKGWFWF